jgi:hypothetical protein
MQIGSASSPQVSQSTNSVQPGSKLQGFQGGAKTQGLGEHQETVDAVGQHLAADPSIKNPGQLHQQAESILRDLTGLEGGGLQELVRQAKEKANEVHLSSGDRWLRDPTTGDQGDTFTLGAAAPQKSGMPTLL